MKTLLTAIAIVLVSSQADASLCCWWRNARFCPPPHKSLSEPTPVPEAATDAAASRQWNIEVFKSGRLTYFRCRSSNGEIVFQSEGYKNHKDALKTIESIQRNVGNAKVTDLNQADTPGRAR